jgi:hypothetical protein
MCSNSTGAFICFANGSSRGCSDDDAGEILLPP